MRRAALAFAVLCVTAWSGAAQAAGPPVVVVELFTSQGCSSCVGSDQLVAELDGKPGVLALTFAVDYWDYLGWNDTFARPEFSARQRAYMKSLQAREVFTPQVVVDGKLQTSGGDRDKIEALIEDASRTKQEPPPMRVLRGHRLQVGKGRAPRGGADVWLVRYDPKDQAVAVKRGENRGQTLTQHNVVRQLVRLGGWYGMPRTYVIPAAAKAGLKTAIVVQAKGGRVVGVLER